MVVALQQLTRGNKNELLEAANEFIKQGRVNSIRLSTRPDYIDKSNFKKAKKKYKCKNY